MSIESPAVLEYLKTEPPSRKGEPPQRRRLAFNTVVFSVATGVSRVAGLAREVVAASYFGTGGPASAFTIAFQVPNLVRSLFADSALSAAFVPVFTDLLEQKKRREAVELAASLFGLILVVLIPLIILFALAAPWIMPFFTGHDFPHSLDQLLVGLSQVLFPIVILLALNGLLVGILNAYDHFAIPAISPIVWNVVIIGLLVALAPSFSHQDQIYAYAIGVVVGTVVQLAMCVPVLRRVGVPLRISFKFNDPRIKSVLRLMLPVTIGLGVINMDLFLNAVFGAWVSEEAPSAIERAFRIYMLPQGMFSVAIATVLFPSLSRLASRRDTDGLREATGHGFRLIALLLIPAAVATIVLSDPITRLIYQRGAFNTHSTHLVGEALFWFSFSLPFSGANLLLTRTFFSLQKTWLPTFMAIASLLVNLALSLALYKPLGIAGLVIGTAVGSIAMTAGQMWFLRGELNGLQLARSARAILSMSIAAVFFGLVAYGVWWQLNAWVGHSLGGQLVSVFGGLALASIVYCALVLLFKVEEAQQILDLVRRRVGR